MALKVRLKFTVNFDRDFVIGETRIMSNINVVLASDANYLSYLEITLKSLLAHNQNLSIFIINTGDISSEWENRLQPYFEQRNSELKLVYLDEKYLENFDPETCKSMATYLRFFIPSLFEYSNSPYWIYLDCDIVINGNIAEPFEEYHFSNFALGAVSDPYVNSLKTHSFINRDYFNAGVLYFNAEQLLAEYGESFTYNLIHHAINLKGQIVYGDQDVLNDYVKNDWISLSKKYNFQLDHIIGHKENTPFEPRIIHFTGPYKPLDKVNFANKNVQTVISLFRLYHSLSWQEIVNLPVGTVKLILSE